MLKRNKNTKKLRSHWIGYGLRPSLEYLEDRLALSGSSALADAANSVGTDLTLNSTMTNVVAGSRPGNLLYQLTITNVGSVAAKDIEVDFSLHGTSDVKSYSVKTSAGRYWDGQWIIDSLKSGKSTVLTWKFTVDSNATLGADAISMTASINPDSRNLFNTEDDRTTASADVTGMADVRAVHYLFLKRAPIDSTFDYLVGMENAGPSTAYNVSAVAILPPGTTLVYSEGGINTDAGLVFNIPKLDSNSGRFFGITVRLDPGVAPNQKLIHMATVSSDTPDSNAKNNQSKAMATAFAQTADLSITQIGPKQAQAGGYVTYQIDVTNRGPFDAKNITLTDLLPTGATFLYQYSNDDGLEFTQSVTSAQVTTTLDQIKAGSGHRFYMVVWFDEELSAGQKLMNHVTVTSNTLDSKSKNNHSAFTTKLTNSSDDLNGHLMLDENRLIIMGSSKNDTVSVQPHPYERGSIQIIMNDKVLSHVTPSYDLVIYGGDGDDVITVDSRFPGQAALFGGPGNDTLATTYFAASTVLVGGQGDDNLMATGGRNILIGGEGNNKLNGTIGENVLIGGSTSYDSNLNALSRLLLEWTDPTSFPRVSYLTRVAHLRGTLTDGNNGKYVLNSSTVTDNAAVDTILSGPDDNDWFLAHTVGDIADKLSDRSSKEELDEI